MRTRLPEYDWSMQEWEYKIKPTVIKNELGKKSQNQNF